MKIEGENIKEEAGVGVVISEELFPIEDIERSSEPIGKIAYFQKSKLCVATTTTDENAIFGLFSTDQMELGSDSSGKYTIKFIKQDKQPTSVSGLCAFPYLIDPTVGKRTTMTFGDEEVEISPMNLIALQKSGMI